MARRPRPGQRPRDRRDACSHYPRCNHSCESSDSPIFLADRWPLPRTLLSRSNNKWRTSRLTEGRDAGQLTHLQIGTHYPLKGFGVYLLEPNTTSSLLTAPILPVGEAFIARLEIVANHEKHPTDFVWSYSWERWQFFRTDLPKAT
jgi:hypothetical protein